MGSPFLEFHHACVGLRKRAERREKRQARRAKREERREKREHREERRETRKEGREKREGRREKREGNGPQTNGNLDLPQPVGASAAAITNYGYPPKLPLCCGELEGQHYRRLHSHFGSSYHGG